MQAAHDRANVRCALLEWYDRHQRDLPWRRRRDPYAIWVSEVMLQQTRVDTVLGYYERFLERFPDVAALAAATEEDVLAEWSGLGYYRRARSLRRAAIEVVATQRWPGTAAEWRQLPGVGDYTAAALASIVNDEPTPVLDGNVERVLTRWLGAAGDPRRRQLRGRLAATAADLLEPGRPGDSNQALMELGATLCRPLHPLCHACPLGVDCQARRQGNPERYPPPRNRRAVERVARRAFLVDGPKGGVWLVRRDPDDSLLAGFWEFPWLDGSSRGAPAEARLEARYRGQWSVLERLGRVQHSITHRRFEVTVDRAHHHCDGGAEGGESGYFSADEIADLPTSSLTRKILALA